MVDFILCLVSLFFMFWVLLLKWEIEELKGVSHKPGLKSSVTGGRSGAVKGNRSFSMD